MWSKILFSYFNNKFFIGNNLWYLEFDKNQKEIWTLIKNISDKKIFITTGPGGFVSNRSQLSFCLGFTFNTLIKINYYNILLDIYPNIYISKKNILYFFQESNRFFYCIFKNDLSTRKFFLLSLEKFLEINSNNFTVGNSSFASYEIKLDFFFLYNSIINCKKKNLNEFLIDYCDEFKF